ncbi:MAG: c-type cytochrome [Proteobacteria bacterium]|nr:c-type cytochrome [Pseudomonadota bacterium]
MISLFVRQNFANVDGGEMNNETVLRLFPVSAWIAAIFAVWCLWPGQHIALADSGVLTDSASMRTSFSHPLIGLNAEQQAQFSHGAAIFRQSWFATIEGGDGGADDSDDAGDPSFVGLGPTFEAKACAACHVRAGRGRPPLRQGEALSSLLIRLSNPGVGEHGEPRPHPAYGDQLQGRAIPGVPPEGRLFVEYNPEPGQYGEGTPYQLRRPVYVFYRMTFLQLGDPAMHSPRIASALPGVGLLEAISESDILARADAEDADGDGISGRPNHVWDPLNKSHSLGRFGWKANQAGLVQQAAGAAFGDMGLTSTLHPGPTCPPPQRACLAASAATDIPELSDERLAALTAYLRYLAPPARHGQENPAVRRGEKLFASAGCAACHTPTARTAKNAVPALSERDITPYSDLLLHDMGQGLADGRPDFEADGREWRTPPLWGLSSLEAVNGHKFLLHDGRARGIAEAILWHGGEALAAREGFRTMAVEKRRDLIDFLRSL